MNETAISVQNLSKKYKIGKQKDASLRGTLEKIFLSRNNNQEEFWALKNISFDVAKGDVVGIIGKNGAGKSTLLKLLSQISKPTEGRIEINGRVASLLEVGTGFHPELTGRENIYLNGTILGMTRKEVKSKFDEIVNFSGVEKFIDTPVKHYSSGMYVRLAFAVAAHLEPEILVIDEVLAVGDAEFQRKCLGKMQDVAGQGRTVLFVSHNMAAVKELCNKGIFMKQGQIQKIGPIDSIISEYNFQGSNDGIYTPEEKWNNEKIIQFKKISLLNEQHEICTDFTVDESISIKFNFNATTNTHPYSLFVIFKNKYGAPIFSAEQKINSNSMLLKIPPKTLTRGLYTIHTFIHIPKVEQIDIAKDICNFTVTDATSKLAIHGDYEYGDVFGNYTWIL